MTKGKILSILSYIGPLFLIGMFYMKYDDNLKFHVNQGLVLFIFIVLSGLVLPVILLFFGLIFVKSLEGFLLFYLNANVIFYVVLNILPLVLMIIGIVNVYNEENKKLPIIGKITIIK